MNEWISLRQDCEWFDLTEKMAHGNDNNGFFQHGPKSHATRGKMSKSSKGKNCSQATRAKFSKAGKCRKHSQASRAKMSKALKGKTRGTYNAKLSMTPSAVRSRKRRA